MPTQRVLPLRGEPRGVRHRRGTLGCHDDSGSGPVLPGDWHLPRQLDPLSREDPGAEEKIRSVPRCGSRTPDVGATGWYYCRDVRRPGRHVCPSFAVALLSGEPSTSRRGGPVHKRPVANKPEQGLPGDLSQSVSPREERVPLVPRSKGGVNRRIAAPQRPLGPGPAAHPECESRA